MRSFYTYILATVLVILFSLSVNAQPLLNRPVTVHATKKPLKAVLNDISKQGKFYFSYNSNIIKEDSIVTISVTNKTVKQVLDMLFKDNISYKEKEKYIILQKADPYWYITGYVYDELTNEGIGYASVYEKQQLVASMTNDHGYFQLRVKDRSQPAVISVSKAWYSDTAIIVSPGSNQAINLKIKPKEMALDSIVITPQVEKNWLGKMFLSSKQRMQSMNLDKVFVDMPVQASVTPGLSTHGKMGSQVVNKFSFNLVGGYTAGVNGFELAGVFNIVKKDVRYAQVAGAFNIVGGNIDGLQIAGAYNQALGSMDGVQISGAASIIKKNVSGAQISGAYAHSSRNTDGVQIAGAVTFTKDTIDGLQIAGATNLSGGKTSGTQIAGAANIARGEVDGAQISGFLNYAKKLDGVQIGILNIADTSSGYSIGLLNLVWKGYHKLSLSTNEILHFNAAFKAGNKNLYSIIFGGANLDLASKAFSFGYGFGSEMALTKWLSLNPELTAQQLYLGDWDHLNLLSKLSLNMNIHVNKRLSLFAGPSFNIYYSNAGSVTNDGYASQIPPANYSPESFGNNVSGWIGWNAGLNLF
jgi:hypothetical protein